MCLKVRWRKEWIWSRSEDTENENIADGEYESVESDKEDSNGKVQVTLPELEAQNSEWVIPINFYIYFSTRLWTSSYRKKSLDLISWKIFSLVG